MWKRLKGLLLAALLLWSCCAAQAEDPVYATTGRFVRALEGAGIACEYQGVDEDGDESVLILSGDMEIYCYFDEACTSAAFYVWYLASYEAAQLEDVLLACSRLNAASGGVCYTADDSDCTVTATMDLLLRTGTAGEVALGAVQHLMAVLPEARQALNVSRRAAATPAPVADDAAYPVGPAATPEPVRAASTPRPTQTVAPLRAQSVVITVDTARVRSGPGVTSPYLLTAKKGDEFPCLGESGGWYIIDCNGRTGFVSMSSAEAR